MQASWRRWRAISGDVLIGIGILVEIARRLGIAFIEIRRQEKQAKAAQSA